MGRTSFLALGKFGVDMNISRSATSLYHLPTGSLIRRLYAAEAAPRYGNRKYTTTDFRLLAVDVITAVLFILAYYLNISHVRVFLYFYFILRHLMV